MFSMNRRWFVANQTGLLKARGHKKGQNRFGPLAAGKMGRCRLAVAAALMAERAEVGCVQVLGSRAELGWLQQLCSWQKGQKLAECSCLAAGKKAEIGWLQ